jgi:phosphate butyryltransferase
MLATLDALVTQAESLPSGHLAVAAAHDPEVLRSVDEAQKRGIATADLIGDAHKIEAIAKDLKLDLVGVIIEDQTDDQEAATRAVSLVREGRANVLVKGQIKTSDLLKAALDRENGIRDKNLLSHIGLFEAPALGRPIILSDAGVVLYPSVEQRVIITQNAVEAAHRLGTPDPRVAILAANDTVHPSRPGSVDALVIARMAQDGWVSGATVEGPMSLDVAVDPEIAQSRGIESPVAGQADIVIVPNVDAGNIAAKALLYVGNGTMAGVVVGARAPIIINSRADDATTRLRSVAMAALVAA